jgi:tetratricopeptide (TPR) repeat protein
MESISLFLGKAEGDNLVYDTDILISFAATLDYLGKGEEAILCYETAINVLLQRVSRDHLSYALAKHELGSIYFRKAKFTDAANMLSDALRIRQLRLGNAHVDTETTLKLLSRSYASSGDSKMALYYFKEVMNARRERSSNTTDSESEIDLLLRLGRLHLQQQEYAEALTCFKDSLRLQRQSVMTCDELKLGETLQCMGSTLIEIKQFHEARLTLLSALRLLGRGGEDSKEVMYVALHLGRVNEEEKSFEKASAWYNRSLAILNNLDNPDEETRARLSFRIGMVKLAEKAYVEALEKVHVAQEAFEGLGSASNLDYAECLNASGRIYNAMKQFDAASNCFQKGLEVRQRQLEATDPDLGDSYHCLGEVLIELQQFEQANSCLSQALGIREENFGIDAQVVGETRRCLGIVEVNLGRLSDANKHFLEAIRIGMRSIESARDMDSDEFDKLMRCFEFVIPMTKDDSNLDMLGKILYQKGTLQSVHKRYRQAMASFTEAVQVFRSMHGEEHLEVANSLFNIGVCLQETEDCDRAMRCFSRALAISRSQLGEDHLEVAETLQHMAEIYRKKEDPKSALSMCEQALHIRRYHEDTALAALLNFSGELYTSVRNGDEAERCFRECVRIRRNLYGDDDMEVSQALYSLGYIHEVFNKDFRRALRCYEESLRIRVTLMENRTEDAARCYLHLGSVHAALGVDSKAFFCFSKAIEMTRQFSNINQKIAEDAIIGQGHALLACGKAVEALVNYERARSQRQERYGVDEKSEDIADMRVFESRALQQLGRNHEALSRLVLALDIYLETVGVNNLGTADTFHCLAELYLKMGQLEDALTCAQQSLIVRKNQLGKLNEAVGESYLVVGKIFFARHDLEKALPCLEAAKEIFQDSNGAQLAVGEAWHYLGCVHGKRMISSPF